MTKLSVKQKYALGVFLISVGFVGLIFQVFVIGPREYRQNRIEIFRGLAERSKPLVSAIKTYEAKYGHPPKNLEELVPEFLNRVPKTGIVEYPDYEYKIVGERESIYYESNPWVIDVFTPRGWVNFDRFMYFPKQNYPEKGYGGELEIFGDWAYIWE